MESLVPHDWGGETAPGKIQYWAGKIQHLTGKIHIWLEKPHIGQRKLHIGKEKLHIGEEKIPHWAGRDGGKAKWSLVLRNEHETGLDAKNWDKGNGEILSLWGFFFASLIPKKEEESWSLGIYTGNKEFSKVTQFPSFVRD